jgi:hypothetical protein
MVHLVGRKALLDGEEPEESALGAESLEEVHDERTVVALDRTHMDNVAVTHHDVELEFRGIGQDGSPCWEPRGYRTAQCGKCCAEEAVALPGGCAIVTVMQMPKDRQGWFRLIGGSLLVLVGIIGIFLPILPGIILILAGMATMAPDSPRISGWFDKGKAMMSKHNIARRWYGGGDDAPEQAEA